VTGQTIQERSFYKRFSPGLVRLLNLLLSRAFEECIGVGRSLKGPLAAFKDVILTDSTPVEKLAAMADRIPEQRWAAIFASVTLELLAAAVRPLRDVRILLRELDRFLLHEAVDPNAGRQGLLVSVERRTHRLHPSAAAA
jgi:hypothetical protein